MPCTTQTNYFFAEAWLPREQGGQTADIRPRALQGRFVTRIAGLLADPMNTAGITSRWMSLSAAKLTLAWQIRCRLLTAQAHPAPAQQGAPQRCALSGQSSEGIGAACQAL